MPTMTITVERFSLVSARSMEAVLADLRAAVGHPDMGPFMQRLTQSRNHTELARIVQDAVGSSGLMEFIAFDLGEVDAGSYAPVTILVDERDDGVHLTYETMVSCLRPYGQAAALSVAGDLDAKIQTLLSAAALGRETA